LSKSMNTAIFSLVSDTFFLTCEGQRGASGSARAGSGANREVFRPS
jgi:hypothetical protein